MIWVRIVFGKMLSENIIVFHVIIKCTKTKHNDTVKRQQYLKQIKQMETLKCPIMVHCFEKHVFSDE